MNKFNITFKAVTVETPSIITDEQSSCVFKIFKDRIIIGQGQYEIIELKIDDSLIDLVSYLIYEDEFNFKIDGDGDDLNIRTFHPFFDEVEAVSFSINGKGNAFYTKPTLIKLLSDLKLKKA